MKIAISTLGCKVNQADSCSLEAVLRAAGHEIVEAKDDPELHVVNTCTVTAKSDYQSRQQIRRAVRTGARVIATGCYAQIKPDEIAGIDGVALIIGNSHKDRLHHYLRNLCLNGSSPKVIVEHSESPLKAKPYSSGRARAFLKIQDGCNFACSYCTVPMARGKSRSLPIHDILRTAEGLEVSGYREIVLSGINIGSYGLDLNPQTSLFTVVEALLKHISTVRIRLSSIEPNEYDHRFSDLIKSGRVCSHLHIPLQSGSDRILKYMNRRYDSSFFMKMMERIISSCPDISIGTDIIVGFPGERDEDFRDTVNFINNLPLNYIHTFPYSKRAHTEAAAFPDHVDKNAKKERVTQLVAISQNKYLSHIQSMLGKELEVIIESNTDNTYYYRGISRHYIRPHILGENFIPGQILAVRADSIDRNKLICIPAL